MKTIFFFFFFFYFYKGDLHKRKCLENQRSMFQLYKYPSLCMQPQPKKDNMLIFHKAVLNAVISAHQFVINTHSAPLDHIG